jgi:hypothetical protein
MQAATHAALRTAVMRLRPARVDSEPTERDALRRKLRAVGEAIGALLEAETCDSVRSTLHCAEKNIQLRFRLAGCAKISRHTCKLAGEIAAALLDARCEAFEIKDDAIFLITTSWHRMELASSKTRASAQLAGFCMSIAVGAVILGLCFGFARVVSNTVAALSE